MNKEIDQPNICFCAFHNCSVVCGECYLFKLKQDYTSRHIEHCHNIAMESLIKEPKQEIERGITITHVDKQETHICKYCGAETSQSDNECYAKPKQETLEEASERYVRNEPITTLRLISKYSFKDGAKWQQEQYKIDTDDAYNEGFENGKHWQQERSYSEEDLIKFVSFTSKNYIKAKGFYYMKGDFEKKHKVSIYQILEQFKKK